MDRSRERSLVGANPHARRYKQAHLVWDGLRAAPGHAGGMPARHRSHAGDALKAPGCALKAPGPCAGAAYRHFGVDSVTAKSESHGL